MRNYLISIFAAVLIVLAISGCSNKKELMINTRDYIQNCTKELVDHFKESGEMEKEFEYHKTKFTMKLNDNGIPEFFDGEKRIDSLNFQIEEQHITVILLDGTISVAAE